MNITHNNDLHNGAINQTLQYDPNGNNEIANSNEIFNIGSAHGDDKATEQSFAPDFTSISIPNWCYKKILKSNLTKINSFIHFNELFIDFWHNFNS